MHALSAPLLVFCAAVVVALAVILPMEWNRLTREQVDPDKSKRRPGQLSQD